jgi:hypothetical protein
MAGRERIEGFIMNFVWVAKRGRRDPTHARLPYPKTSTLTSLFARAAKPQRKVRKGLTARFSFAMHHSFLTYRLDAPKRVSCLLAGCSVRVKRGTIGMNPLTGYDAFTADGIVLVFPGAPSRHAFDHHPQLRPQPH